jgi:hypothetical protein
LGLVEAQTEIDGLSNEVERWRNDPDTMKAEVEREMSGGDES